MKKLLITLFLLATAVAASAAGLADRVREHTLANGMKLLLVERHTSPTVAAWIRFRVGAVDEQERRAGDSAPARTYALQRDKNPRHHRLCRGKAAPRQDRDRCPAAAAGESAPRKGRCGADRQAGEANSPRWRKRRASMSSRRSSPSCTTVTAARTTTPLPATTAPPT